MDFYTLVLRRSGKNWVSLCLENGLVGQGTTKEIAVEKLKEAIASLQEAKESDEDIYTAPLTVKELHEFLTVEHVEPVGEPLELRAVYA